VTHLRCGGIFNDSFIASFLLNQTVKKIENRSIFGEAMDKIIFFDSWCISIYITSFSMH